MPPSAPPPHPPHGKRRVYQRSRLMAKKSSSRHEDYDSHCSPSHSSDGSGDGGFLYLDSLFLSLFASCSAACSAALGAETKARVWGVGVCIHVRPAHENQDRDVVVYYCST